MHIVKCKMKNPRKVKKERNRHAELGSASHRIKTHETLKQVQGDRQWQIKNLI